MISKGEFERIKNEALCNLNQTMTKMQTYKKYLQYEVLKYASTDELIDVKYCKYNNNLVDKLIKLAGEEWDYEDCGELQSLYCASMAVATIVKEYGWGTKFLTDDGLFEMASLISDSLLHHSNVLHDQNFNLKDIVYSIELYTRFLGLTEEEINKVGFMGIPFRKLNKIRYPHNMIGIAYIVSQTQKFLLFLDNDFGGKVVCQRTYWGHKVNTFYEQLKNDKALRIESKPKYFETDGYMIQTQSFNRVLVEKGMDDNEPYIATSINI